MEARHGRKLGSAAYEIAHDTEPPGRLAPEVSLSRIRGLTCEILAHAPTPSPFQFPLFPFLFLSTAVSPPFDNPLSLPLSLARSNIPPSLSANRPPPLISYRQLCRCSFLPQDYCPLPPFRSSPPLLLLLSTLLGWISSSGWHHASDKYLVLVQLGTELCRVFRQ